MSPEEIKQSLSKILLAEDKAAELLETFGSVKNMQVVVTSNLKMFVDELIDITALFFRPIIERNGGDLPNKKVMAKLLDESVAALVEFNISNGGSVKTPDYSSLIEKLDSISPNLIEYIRYALSAFLVGHTNAGKKLLELALLEVINSERFLGEIQSQAFQKEVKSTTARKAAKLGQSKRWQAKENTRLYALQLFHEKAYRNANQAAEDITEKVFNYGKTQNFHFTGIYQASKTIYKWLLAETKNK